MKVPFLFQYLNGQLLIPESVKADCDIAVIRVGDEDSKSSGVTVKLQDHKQDFSLRETIGNQYIISVKRRLSLKRRAKYKMKIVAKEHGKQEPRNNSYVLHVKLVRNNRPALRFTRKVYDVSLVDNVTPGVIARMNVTDKDFRF